MRQKITKNKIAFSILVILALIIYLFWNLHNGVSNIEQKLLKIESISGYTKYISNFYYIIAVLSLLLGIFLGLALGAYSIIKKRQIN